MLKMLFLPLVPLSVVLPAILSNWKASYWIKGQDIKKIKTP